MLEATDDFGRIKCPLFIGRDVSEGMKYRDGRYEAGYSSHLRFNKDFTPAGEVWQHHRVQGRRQDRARCRGWGTSRDRSFAIGAAIYPVVIAAARQ